MNTRTSDELFEKAKTLFPGGVNSPVRAFTSVGGNPVFFRRGEGAYVWDEDGNKYLDFCCSWGPLILGHAHPRIVKAVQDTAASGSSFGAPTRLENELASLIINNHRYIEKIRFVSSGTEAVMSAVRLARGTTGRDKIIKFEGCYHGHADGLLVKAGSGLVTLGSSSSAGVPKSFANETIVVPLNNEQAIINAFAEFKNEIAAVLMEPVPANNGLLIQDGKFLRFLRDMTKENSALLIFDEVISGFRIGFEGAAGYYDIQPDIIALGKIIGGGMPVGAYAGAASIMDHVAPQGNVYQAGTLSGNPVAMAAGIAQLTECMRPGFYEELKERTDFVVNNMNNYARQKNYRFRMFSHGSIFWFSFSDNAEVRSADAIDEGGVRFFAHFHKAMLEQGIYLGPSGYEVGFISAAHTDADIHWAVKVMCTGLDQVYNG